MMADAPAQRLPKFDPVTLGPAARELYDAIAGGPRAQGRQAFALTDTGGGLEGPFNAMLLSPALGGALQALGSAVRYESALSDREREIAILLVAQQLESTFETYAHEAVGRSVGLTDAELDQLRKGIAAAFDDERERLIGDVTLALTTRGDLTDAEFSAAREGLGLSVIFELTTLVGYYATLALQLRLFRVGAPDSRS